MNFLTEILTNKLTTSFLIQSKQTRGYVGAKHTIETVAGLKELLQWFFSRLQLSDDAGEEREARRGQILVASQVDAREQHDIPVDNAR